MKRIYEFRGKVKASKLWVYGSLFVDKEKTYIIVKGVIYDERTYIIVKGSLIGGVNEVISESVGQLIGRRDKNKKEIYAGDIVKWVNNFGERIIGWVRYTHSIAGFSVILIKGGYVTFYEGNKRNFAWSSLRIVGNKTENPEMMKYEYWKENGETKENAEKRNEFLKRFKRKEDK